MEYKHGVLASTNIAQQIHITNRYFKEESILQEKGSELRRMQSNQLGNVTEYLDGNNPGDSKCEPMYDWQLSSFPNCNCMHESDVMHMKMINTG